mmetsp:Transcript_22506/g.35327  ORF Transcript_22506/g.35327 Transcript_22506/m.35327 type:complete len:115 (-) Transcript_22506:761-1105(-)
MSATGSGYDLSVTTFSPDGRVFQVEYATKAIEKSGTAIGIRCVDGVVLGVEKSIISRMILTDSNRRIHTVGTHSGIVCEYNPFRILHLFRCPQTTSVYLVWRLIFFKLVYAYDE